MRTEWIALIALLASACGLSHIAPENTAADGGSDAGVDPATCEGSCGPEPDECASEGEECGFGFGSSCCSGTECRFITYGMSTCVVPLADGSECVYSAQCASNRCADGLCRSPECREEAGDCELDHECCRGVCAGGPSDGAYGWGSCATPLAPGSTCVRDGWCESRSCVEGRCE